MTLNPFEDKPAGESLDQPGSGIKTLAPQSAAHQEAKKTWEEERRTLKRADRMAALIAEENDPEGVEAVYFPLHALRGGQNTPAICCYWPRRARKDADGTPSGAAEAAAWDVIDGKTFSVLGIVASIFTAADGFLTDENLSPVGRRTAIANNAAGWAQKMERAGRQWIAARLKADELAHDLAGVEPYKASQPWQWAIDLEIARSLRELPEKARAELVGALRMGERADIAEGIIRLPAHLSGITEAQHTGVLAAVIDAKNPGHSASARTRSAALHAAAVAIDTGATLLERAQWLETKKTRELMGADVAAARSYAQGTVVHSAAYPDRERLAVAGVRVTEGGAR